MDTRDIRKAFAGPEKMPTLAKTIETANINLKSKVYIVAVEDEDEESVMMISSGPAVKTAVIVTNLLQQLPPEVKEILAAEAKEKMAGLLSCTPDAVTH